VTVPPRGLPRPLPSRRDFLRLTAAAALLAACGTSSGDDDTDASPSPSTRSVTSDGGSVEVPAEPQRVVAAIGSFETDIVAVGIMPVLTTSFAGPWVELDDSVTITQNIPPTAEELLQVDPDLMLGWTWVTAEPGFDEMQQIAPYVGLGESAETAGPGFDGSEPFRSWDTLFLSVADAVGRRDRGEELVAELEGRLDELADRRSGEPPTSAARIEFYEAGSFSYRGQEEDTAELMRRIGLEVVGPKSSIPDASLERLPEIDSDWLVVPVGTDSIPRNLYEEVARTDLFRSIPAVQAARVLEVDAALWPGFGHLWARALTDDLERLFVPA
jgi:iron complex transport system substrate-binding protein